VEFALRASDADREQAVAELERHTAAGRLSLDEFEERVTRALAALTRGDLAAVLHDLPVEPPASADPHRTGARQLAVAFLLAASTIVMLAILLAVFG